MMNKIIKYSRIIIWLILGGKKPFFKKKVKNSQPNKKKEKNSYSENYFDASDFMSLLCSQGFIILDKLRLLKQTVS